MAASQVLTALRTKLARDGLHIVLPLSEASFDGVCSRMAAPRLRALLKTAAGAVIVGDGGPEFFAFFRRALPGDGAGTDQPLDAYTRAVVDRAVDDVLGPGGLNIAFRVTYPFTDEQIPLPFQQLGVAAGLPPPGPLGIQVHPTYGPWWAYRALVVLAAPLVDDAAMAAPCVDCPAPCQAACPAGAVTSRGFDPASCGGHRLRAVACHEACAARTHCPVGRAQGYPASQLAFHMRSSLHHIRMAARAP